MMPVASAFARPPAMEVVPVQSAQVLVLWLCLAIALIVFVAMGHAMFRAYTSRRQLADPHRHGAPAEVVWTLIPLLMLVLLVWPAGRDLVRGQAGGGAEMTVRMVGAPEMWTYEYLDSGVQVVSHLSVDDDDAPGRSRDATAAGRMDVDTPLTLPINTRIRVVVSGYDLLVPAALATDGAVAGNVQTQAVLELPATGLYRRHCEDLCAPRDAGLPIVVQAVSREDFDLWIDRQQGGWLSSRLVP